MNHLTSSKLDLRFIDTQTKRNSGHYNLCIIIHPALMDGLLLCSTYTEMINSTENEIQLSVRNQRMI